MSPMLQTKAVKIYNDAVLLIKPNKDCSEQEFNLFKDLNSRFKNKFNIPFIFAVRNKNKNEIITEFKSRLENNDLNLEIKTSISQVKEIAKLRLTELINE